VRTLSKLSKLETHITPAPPTDSI